MAGQSSLSIRRRVWRMATPAAFSLTCLLPARAPAQARPIELRVEPCTGCKLTERVVATLGHPNDSVRVTMWSRVVKLGATRYLVGPVDVAGRLAIYRSDGTLERVIALAPVFRPDGTPWELPHQVGPIFASTSGGAVVVDQGNGRLTLIDTLGRMRTYADVRGVVSGGLALPDGRLVINAQYPPGDRLGRPLHVIDGRGIVRSIGPAAGRVGPIETPLFRALAAARDGHFWVSPRDTYELSLNDSLGRVTATLTRPFSSPPPGPSATAAFGISSIHEDANGYLWVAFIRRGSTPDVKPDERMTSATLRALSAGLTSTIDVIDPMRGAVIFSQTFDGPGRPFISDSLVWRYREDASHGPSIEISALRLALTAPRGKVWK